MSGPASSSPRPLRVSAVIPTYNYGRYVARAVQSVLDQTYPHLECIVVDDGSTDDTPAVLARFGDRIRNIRKPNAGLSAARNTGIRAAGGDAIGLLDADDHWKPEKIARQVALLEQDRAVGAVGCGVANVEEEDGSVQLGSYPWPDAGPRGLQGVALREQWVGGSGSGALIRREVLDHVGLFDERLRAAEDWDMWLRIAATFQIANVPETLTTITRHRNGTFRNPTKMETAQLAVYRHAIERWPDKLPEGIRRQMRAMILADAGAEYLSARDDANALRKYAASLAEWPLSSIRWKVLANLLLKRTGLRR